MNIKQLPCLKILRQKFELSTKSPSGLIHKQKHSKADIGDFVGSLNQGKYKTSISGKTYLCHRIVYSLFHNVELNMDLVIDHIDRNPQNNNPLNLRLATYGENLSNMSKHKTSSSKYYGVSKRADGTGWNWSITFNGIKKSKRFKTELEAAKYHNKFIYDNNLYFKPKNIID